jgi:TPR repeat protein
MNIYRLVLLLPGAIVIGTAVALVSALWQPSERDTALITAVEYFDAGMYKRALPFFRTVAEKGNGEAANFLGVMFESGQGDLPCDPIQAAAWYRRAADLGDPEGMLNLGRMYHAGTGVPRDEVQALRWYYKAAARGSGPSMTSIGVEYLLRSGVENEVAAAKWFQRGADAGDPFGMFAIATMYKTSRGNLPEDDFKAKYWNNRANGALRLLSTAPMHTLVRRGY